jgi:hypothetical protein
VSIIVDEICCVVVPLLYFVFYEYCNVPIEFVQVRLVTSVYIRIVGNVSVFMDHISVLFKKFFCVESHFICKLHNYIQQMV